MGFINQLITGGPHLVPVLNSAKSIRKISVTDLYTRSLGRIKARYPCVLWPRSWTIAHSTWMVPRLISFDSGLSTRSKPPPGYDFANEKKCPHCNYWRTQHHLLLVAAGSCVVAGCCWKFVLFRRCCWCPLIQGPPLTVSRWGTSLPTRKTDLNVVVPNKTIHSKTTLRYCWSHVKWVPTHTNT